MGEKLLKAILRILVVVAKEEGVTEDEREAVSSFLLQNVPQDDVKKYLDFVDKETQRLPDNLSLEVCKNYIERIIVPMNSEMTAVQKSIIIVNLVHLIAADGVISLHEDELLRYIGMHFKMDSQVVQTIKHFVIEREVKRLDNPHVLFITGEDPAPVLVGKHVFSEHMDAPILILNLEAHGSRFIKYLGKQELYLNGSILRPNTTVNYSSGSIIKTKSGHTLFYSDVVSQFLQKRARSNYVLSAKGVGYKFKSGDRALRDINFEESSGRLVAIMGMSGSGKTTLLNVLNGSETPTEGQVFINGIDVHAESEELEGIIGYIPQDDLLIEDLTVFENLYYAAKLCFKDLKNVQIKNKVNRVLINLGLEEIKGLKVGSPLQKIISGGQRKRVNIAMELIREPSVLFVDEPTSGLSSRDSEKVVDLLKELSLKGKLVIMVIHQPSSDIFKMFDRLLFLDSGGYRIYYGNPIQGVTYFKEMMDRVDKAHGQCVECGNVNPEQIFSIVEGKLVDEFGRETHKRRVAPETWYKWFQDYQRVDIKAEKIPLAQKATSVPSKFSQFLTFAQRDIRAKSANRQYRVMNLAAPAILSCVLALIVRYVPEGKPYVFSENVNIPAYFFMSILVALFMALTVSSEEIFKDRKILKREAFLHLSRSSYLFSKILVLFSMSGAQTMIYVLIGDFILHIQDMTFSYWLILFSTSCFANMLGLNVSSMFNSIATIYITVPIMLIPQIILSGIVVNFDHLHPALSSESRVPFIGELMASRWAYEALVVTQYKDNPVRRRVYPYEKEIHLSEYQVSYHIPSVRSRLSEAKKMLIHGVEDEAAYARWLRVVKNETAKYLAIYGEDKLPLWSNLVPARFDIATYAQTSEFLDIVKSAESHRRKKWTNRLRQKVQEVTDTPEKEKEYARMRSNYDNKHVELLVKNVADASRVVEEDGRLYAKLYPIYHSPRPEHALDFRTRLFYPEKYLAGMYFPTLYFNVAVLWVMSILLMFLLRMNVWHHLARLYVLVKHRREKKRVNEVGEVAKNM